MQRIGFLVNPIAGMGGRVGLKGTDGVYEEAIRRGAKPVTPDRARQFLKTLKSFKVEDIVFLVPGGNMGEDFVKECGFAYRVIYNAPENTDCEDTKNACRNMVKNGAELIVFVGGDGTARDVADVVDSSVLIVGVPSGVKMYSAVFCNTPASCGELVYKYISGETKIKDAEILDIDEDAYRRNTLKIKLYGFAKTPYVDNLVQSSKTEYGYEDEEDKEAIGEYFSEIVEPDTLYILGAGTTIAKIAEKLGAKKTLLGVDAYFNGHLVGVDLDERGILDLLDRYPRVKLVVTPIGTQGFVFGRGNQQISVEVLRKIGKENIIIVATPLKLSSIHKLKIDIDGGEFLRGYYRVLVGYGKYKMMKLE